MIASKPTTPAPARKDDALRSLRTPGMQSLRPATPGQPPRDHTYNFFGRLGAGNPRWHPSPLVSESQNPH